MPACPEWTVADLVAHLVDVCSGTLGAGPPPHRAGLGVLLARWARAAREGAPAIALAGRRAGPLVLDAFSHELDVRRALELPPPDGDPAYEPAYAFVLELASSALSASLDRHGLPDLVMATPSTGPRRIGRNGGPVATVRTARHDLLRSLTGRRAEAQIAALDWSDDPTPWLPAFRWGPFSPPSRPTE